MFERFLPKQYGYFDLFERHSKLTLDAVKELGLALLDLQNAGPRIARIEELEHEADSVAHMTMDLLRRSYITPFDRDEIRLLISRMDDIVDFVEAFAHRLDLFEVTEVPADMPQLCDVLCKAQEQVVHVVEMLRRIRQKEDLSKHCREINRLENEGDRLNRAGIARLFHDHLDPLLVIKYKELYEVLEAAIDSCEDVADVVEGIVLEHVG